MSSTYLFVVSVGFGRLQVYRGDLGDVYINLANASVRQQSRAIFAYPCASLAEVTQVKYCVAQRMVALD